MINLKHLFLIIQFLIVLCGCNASTDYVPRIGRLVRPQMQTLAAERRNGYECRLVEFCVDDSYVNYNLERNLRIHDAISFHPSWVTALLELVETFTTGVVLSRPVWIVENDTMVN